MTDPSGTPNPAPANSAHALHLLLTQIAASRQPAATAWSSALDAQYGTPDFARKHAEAVGLLLDTIRAIGALPGGAASRQMTYVSAWWTAVLAPESHWRAPSEPASGSITESALNHLADLGDLLTALLPGTVTAPTGNADLTALAAQAQQWLATLSTTSDVSEPIRRVLTGQIQHLLWLISHADLFGTAHVAQHAETVTGALVRAGSTISERAAREAWGGRTRQWATTINNVTVVVAAVAGLLTATHLGLDAAASNIEGVHDVVTAVIDYPAEPSEPAQLPPGPATG